MAMDDRKQRILMAIVSLYSADGEPVGSNLLSRHFDMAVSSATLRNEMAALTRLGLLEQPHTSAGRVPTAKGYRYYVDNLIESQERLSPSDKQRLEQIFHELDLDPEKMAQGAAKSLSKMLGFAVAVTTPRGEDVSIAHYEIIQVGRYSAAVLAVTEAGGVRTRVAKVEFELHPDDVCILKECLNQHLRFVSQADVTPTLIQSMVSSLGPKGHFCWPVISAALTLLAEASLPSTFFEGQHTFLQWPELEPSLRTLMAISSAPEKLEELIKPQPGHTTVIFGDELEHPIPGLCVVSRQYVAGNGLLGTLAVAGPIRMNFREVLPRFEYFSNLLGLSMSGSCP